MSLFPNASVLLGKELRTEFRSRELLTTTVVFILMIVVLFSFTFDPTREESRRFGPGLLWLAFLFAASLMLQPGFLREQTNDTLSALRLSVSDPFSIFLSKLCANTRSPIQCSAAWGCAAACVGAVPRQSGALRHGHNAFRDFGAGADA